MSRTAFVTASALLLSLSACARQADHPPAATTITSGGTASARGTDARPDTSQVSNRLADEICARETECNHVANGGLYRSDEACLVDQGARAAQTLSRWTCTPELSSGSFAGCLAAVRNEHCETTLTRADALEACRSAAVCGR